MDGVDSLDGLLAAELGPDAVVGDPGWWWGSASAASTTTTTTRPVPCSVRHSPARSSWPTATAWPWSSTPGRPGTTRSHILTAAGVPERTIIHCFTGGPDEARRCLDLGASLSFSGVVTFKNAAEVREAAALCPMDRLLVETDTPFLAPVPHRGTLNEPSRVPLVGAAIAQVKGITTWRWPRSRPPTRWAAFTG